MDKQALDKGSEALYEQYQSFIRAGFNRRQAMDLIRSMIMVTPGVVAAQAMKPSEGEREKFFTWN